MCKMTIPIHFAAGLLPGPACTSFYSNMRTSSFKTSYTRTMSSLDRSFFFHAKPQFESFLIQALGIFDLENKENELNISSREMKLKL